MKPFYKDHLCQAVCGMTVRDLLNRASDNVGAHTSRMNFDTPRSDGDKLVDRLNTFNTLAFQVPLLPLADFELYDAADKFRMWEEQVHPRAEFPRHEAYWGPAYNRIDAAYAADNSQELRSAVQELVDKIMHD
jgi:hypothetical protein